MSISQQNIIALSALYARRRSIAKATDDAAHNFWVGVVNGSFGGTGTRADLVEVLGGRGEFVAIYVGRK